ncbi:MAG: TolC family protein, partial [Nitrospira sp.]
MIQPKILSGRFAHGLLSPMAAAGLAGCFQGANYQRPPLEVPADWDQLSGRDPEAGVPINAQQLPDVTWWQSFQNEELTALIERSVAHNHDVRQATLRVLEGRAILMSAGAGLYPQLNVQGAYSRVQISENTVAGLGLAKARINPAGAPQTFANPGQGFDLWNTFADLRWELDLWGRIRRGMEAAAADSEAIVHDVRAVALSLVGDVGDA